MKKKDGMPALVYWTLLGMNSKLLTWLCFLVSFVCGIALLIKEGAIGVVFLIAAALYLNAIRWVNENSTWG